MKRMMIEVERERIDFPSSFVKIEKNRIFLSKCGKMRKWWFKFL